MIAIAILLPYYTRQGGALGGFVSVYSASDKKVEKSDPSWVIMEQDMRIFEVI